MTQRNNKNQKRTVFILGTGALLVAGAVWMLTGNGFGPGTAALQPTESIMIGDLEELGGFEGLAEMGVPVEFGDPEAPFIITEFGDYQCPACQDFASLVKPQIDMQYVESGIARFVFYDYPRHNHSFLAHRAARCARDQNSDAYWNFHNRLFARQSAWAVSGSPPMGAFESIADEIGLDVDDFASCLASEQHADVVSANLRVGIEIGIMGTPSILVNRVGSPPIRVSRWNDFSAIAETIDRLMAEDQGLE